MFKRGAYSHPHIRFEVGAFPPSFFKYVRLFFFFFFFPLTYLVNIRNGVVQGIDNRGVVWRGGGSKYTRAVGCVHHGKQRLYYTCARSVLYHIMVASPLSCATCAFDDRAIQFEKMLNCSLTIDNGVICCYPIHKEFSEPNRKKRWLLLGSGSPTACLSMAPFLFSLHISRSKYAIHFFYAAKKPFWREIGKKKKMSDASTKWM